MPITEQRVDARDTLLAPQAVRREFQTLPSLITAKGSHPSSTDMKVIETTPIQSDARKTQASSFILAHRIFTLRFVVPGVNRSTAVAVSLTEVSGDQPFIGDATMKVYNVAPRDGGEVDVRGEIDWDTDLLVRVNFIF